MSWPYILILAGLLVIRTYFFSLSVVRGVSMVPTFSEGDLVFVNKWSAGYQPGDVIIFQDPRSKSKLVKRLIAAENTEIYVDNFKLYVNQKPYSESAEQPPVWDQEAFECRYSDIYRTKVSELFVMGDNRCKSKDSRVWGPVKQANVVGKVAFVLVPRQWNPLYKLGL